MKRRIVGFHPVENEAGVNQTLSPKRWSCLGRGGYIRCPQPPRLRIAQVSNGGGTDPARDAAAFFAADFFAVFFAAVFLRAVFLAAFLVALRGAGASAPSDVAAFLAAVFLAAVFLAAAFLAPRRGRLGAASSSALHSSWVSDFGSRSLGMRAFFSPSVM